MILTPDARIEALEPWGLGTVPGFDPAAPADDAWRVGWKRWADDVTLLRSEILQRCEDDARLRQLQMRVCADSPTYWLAMFGWIEEPRPRDGEDTIKPFLPFSYQAQIIDWFATKTAEPARFDGFVSKPRELGVSWTFVAAAMWAWLYRPWRGKFISAVEEKVDKPLDADTLFGKLDIMLDHLPWWMLPAGFDPERHRMARMLHNPATKAQINGHATSRDATRGTRATYAVADEAAFFRDNLFTPVWNTLSGATPHRWGVSSENIENGRQWWDTWHAAKKLARPEVADVLELSWQDNAYLDQAWYAAEYARWEASNDVEGFHREYLRDPWAGSKGVVYAAAKDLPLVAEGWVPDVDLHVGIDPGMKDECALVFAQVLIGEQGERKVRVVDAYQNSMKTAEFYAHILTGEPPEPGDSCWGVVLTNRDRRLMEWLQHVPPHRLKAYMDPAGTQINMSGLSFLDRLVRESRRLRARQAERAADGEGTEAKGRAITPRYREIQKRIRHESRHLAVRELLPVVEVTDNQGGNEWLNAMTTYKWAAPTAKATSDPRILHDENSHLVTAFEFLCAYLSLLRALAPKQPRPQAKPTRSVWGRSHAGVPAARQHVAA